MGRCAARRLPRWGSAAAGDRQGECVEGAGAERAAVAGCQRRRSSSAGPAVPLRAPPRAASGGPRAPAVAPAAAPDRPRWATPRRPGALCSRGAPTAGRDEAGGAAAPQPGDDGVGSSPASPRDGGVDRIAFEEIVSQQRRLAEDLETLLDCLHASGAVSPDAFAKQRLVRRRAALMNEFLSNSALVQGLSAAMGPASTSALASACSTANSGVRSLQLLCPKATGERCSSDGGSSTTAEGAPVLEEDVDPTAGSAMQALALCDGDAAPVPVPSGAPVAVAASPAGAPSAPTPSRSALTAKLLTGLLLGWRRPALEDVPDPPQQVVFKMPGLVGSIAKFAGAVACKRLSEACGRVVSESLRGDGLLKDLMRTSKSVFVCGGSSGTPADTVNRFDPASGAWQSVPPMQIARRACAATSTGGHLYILGGVDVATPAEEGQRSERFDPVTGEWSYLAPLGRQYTHAAAAAAGGFVYVFGGLSCGSVLDQAQRYDPTQNVWECLEPMPTPRFECAAAAAKNELYVLGGANVCGDPLAAAECYSPATGRWRALPDLAVPRYGCAAASVRGLVYIIGGHGFWESLMEAEVYDPAGEASWRVLPRMPSPRNRCGAVAADGLIYVFGGTWHGQDATTVECFDSEAEQWNEPAFALPQPRGHCIVAAVSS